MLFVGLAQDFPGDTSMADFDQRCGADTAHGADQFNGESVGHFDHIEQDTVAFFKRRRILDEQSSEFRVTGVGHSLKTRELHKAGLLARRGGEWFISHEVARSLPYFSFMELSRTPPVP